ncbi:hypothetical protein B0H11DRAFT_1928161 [Mycena galericulata]|nr:hypothetical protein B0H11DRAFT_1928161 [Mycena galericulata]
MVWVSNYASVSIVVSVTTHTGGDSGKFTLYPKQNETWGQNHWNRKGPETITITWAGGKTTSFKIEKDDHVLVWDDAYGVESNVITTKVADVTCDLLRSTWDWFNCLFGRFLGIIFGNNTFFKLSLEQILHVKFFKFLSQRLLEGNVNPVTGDLQLQPQNCGDLPGTSDLSLDAWAQKSSAHKISPTAANIGGYSPIVILESLNSGVRTNRREKNAVGIYPN